MGIVFVAALLVVLGVKSFSRDLVEVRAAGVNHQNLVSSVSTNGKVEPVDEFQAHAMAPGVVEEIFVEVGQKVKAGQLLVKLNDSDAAARLASATAALRSAEVSAHDVQQNGSQDERIGMAGDLNRAQMQQKQATSDVQALRSLQQKGAASAAEVTAAEQRLLTANSTLQSLQQRTTGRYSSAERARSQAQLVDAQAALKAANVGYASVNIRTPKSGTVYSIPVAEYDFVPAGEDLMDVADLNRIQIRAYFDEPEIGKLAPGQAVKIVWDAKPTQAWHGHIERAPTTVITYGTRNVGECLITVDDARGDLLPNTNVTVTVTTAQRFNVLSVPREALHTEGGDFVYRVIGGKLIRTPVVIGIFNLTRVEIVSGLTDKDTVALNATSNRDLSPGLAVKVIE
ncbi:efflux RND transporter periplasmic adaptor subunit [Granulicella sp. dw_53]|uniref:efflux RND transporter periplasmic adaptor subunit n=1 Tax=Granulicella sp. dw_53 TaxID=2719792 RepID=UPI0021077D20|nr:efflux RND transporter periplasmic adaptor subunit [Granulicella sp. dw_53]